MIGVFDSGAGGLTAIYELKKAVPTLDICFLQDRVNAPYGIRTKNDLQKIVRHNVEKLLEAGASKVLMACCTASTVYDSLPNEIKPYAIPIISPTVSEAARQTQSGRIGVIATNATVSSHKFSDMLLKHDTVKEVFELQAQKIVELVEGGATDGHITSSERSMLSDILSPLYSKNIDTLILGCTHFPHLEYEISRLFKNTKIISSSREGAKEILKNKLPCESGRIIYL